MPARKASVLRASDVQKALEDIGRTVNNLRAVVKWVSSTDVLARFSKAHATPPPPTGKAAKAGWYIGPWPLFIGECHEVALPLGESKVPARRPAVRRRTSTSRRRK